MGYTIDDKWVDDGTNISPKGDRELLPQATDGAALGSGTVMWSDVFLASGGVINFNNGDVTLTHSAGLLTLSDPLTITNAGTIDADGVDLLTGNAYEINGTSVLNATTLGSAVVTSSLTTVGALNSGSITSGFGNIDNGASSITTTGDITGGGIHVTGDTAAGDNAALGYTAAEGLVLTGQGSATDVTIKNDADATVMSIATGTTTTTFAGAVATGANDITLTGAIGRDTDNELNWGTDDSLAIVIGGVTSNIVSISTGAGDNDKLVTQGYVDDTGAGDVMGDSASVDKEFVRFNSTTGKAIESPATDQATTTATLSDACDITFYDAVNDGNPVFSYGSSATERITITPTYASGTQTLEYVAFDTPTASGTADYGEYRFSVDGTLVATIDDGGVEIKASGSLSFGAVDILTDSAGTTTLNNIDAIDATTETTLETAIDTLSNLTTVGALNAGSITSGFTSIDVGAGSIDGGTITADTNFAGDLTGNVTGNCTGTSATVTGATQASITTCANLVTVGALDAGSITSNFGTINNGASSITTTGVITGGTVEATTDTSAGDNSALGYTATEGAVLTGQGSTGDVTVKNDADAQVLQIPTGTSNVQLGVDGTASDLILTEKSSVRLDPAGGADGDYSGTTFVGTGGETIAFGEVCYLKAADSEWYKCDADATATGGVVAVAMAVSTSTDGNPVTLLTHGIVRADAVFPALTIGAPVYVGTTAGAIQVAAPSGDTDIVKIVGHALTADEVLVNISPDWIVVTA